MMSSSGEALEALSSVISNALTLVGQLDTVVAGIAAEKQKAADSTDDSRPKAQKPAADVSLDALALAHDAASLIKAHATKISLLIINEPFTPSAVSKVVRELVAGAVPSLAAAVEVCTPKRYTRSIQQDLAWRVSRVLRELRELLSRIPTDGKVLSGADKTSSAGSAGGRGSIATTGVLWSACDDVVAFGRRGFAGNLAHKIDQLRDTLKDVMEELKEWGEETEDNDSDDDDGDGQADEDADGVGQVTSQLASSSLSSAPDAQAILDEFMNSQRYIPADDPDKIRPRLDSCVKRLRLTALLYQAAVKRRVRSLPHLPPESDVPARLDEVIPILKRLPEKFGSLAMAFYELDPSEIDRLMDECFFDAFAASELLAKPWEGQRDEFTDWALRFQVEIKKG